MDIKDHVILVSGGASGLGEATCRLFAQRGASGIGIIDRDVQRGQRVAGELGERALFAPADITRAEEVDAAVAAIAKRFGAIHSVVNCAAIGLPARLIGRKGPIPMEKFDQVMKVNLYGTVHVLRAAVPVMMENTPNSDGERGVIINVASGAAYEASIGQVAYAASKAAVVGMTIPLARELAEVGIRVLTIAPGGFDTPIYDSAPPTLKESLAAQMIFPKRMGRAPEFAHFAAEIVENAMHNGRAYRFDAGMTLPA
jgi:NAD(P)-dependent dehydrogenase (short-subunit alcohol dehydrogenase family)